MVRSLKWTALDFFAGSGLVRLGLEPEFTTAWANDKCPKKGAVYNSNADTPLRLGSIEHVSGSELPAADLAWASFPCQDLSLAGNLTGIRKGTRSGLFWQWMRVIDELAAAGKKPPVLVAENVVGFLVAGNGAHFKRAYAALKDRDYIAGALVVDARHFLPQSRPRAFIIAVPRDLPIHEFATDGPTPPFHSDPLVRASRRCAVRRSSPRERHCPYENCRKGANTCNRSSKVIAGASIRRYASWKRQSNCHYSMGGSACV